jgi:hypothetical protein
MAESCDKEVLAKMTLTKKLWFSTQMPSRSSVYQYRTSPFLELNRDAPVPSPAPAALPATAVCPLRLDEGERADEVMVSRVSTREARRENHMVNTYLK